MALKQLIALTQIEVTIAPGVAGNKLAGVRPVAPKSRTIPKGAKFKAMTKAQEDELFALGSVSEDPDATAESSKEVTDLGSASSKKAAKAAQESEGAAAELEAARAAYRDEFTEEPHPAAKAETLRDKIEKSVKAREDAERKTAKDAEVSKAGADAAKADDAGDGTNMV